MPNERSSFSLVFFINRAKRKVNGECPVYLKININGQKLSIQLKRHVLPEQWDGETSRMRGRSGEARVFNDYLDSVRFDALKKYNELITLHDQVTVKLLRDAILGVDTARARMLLEVWEEHVQSLHKLVRSLSILSVFD